MEDAIKGIEKAALQQSKKAVRMWAECRQILESAAPDKKAVAMTVAMELNRRAIDQAREALNRLDFVRRYRSTAPRAHFGVDESVRTMTSVQHENHRRAPGSLQLK